MGSKADVFTKADFRKLCVDSGDYGDLGYFVEELDNILSDNYEKLVYLTIEGESGEKEETRFAYDTIEAIIDTKKEADIRHDSKVGEEQYSLYLLDTDDREITDDIPFLNRFPVGRVVRVDIPGLTDYVLVF